MATAARSSSTSGFPFASESLLESLEKQRIDPAIHVHATARLSFSVLNPLKAPNGVSVVRRAAPPKPPINKGNPGQTYWTTHWVLYIWFKWSLQAKNVNRLAVDAWMKRLSTCPDEERIIRDSWRIWFFDVLLVCRSRKCIRGISLLFFDFQLPLILLSPFVSA